MSRQQPDAILPRVQKLLRLRVVRSERVSADFVRVTLGGDDLAHFEAMGRDQWFRLFLPQDAEREPTLPSAADARWWPEVLRIPEHERPYVRNYTVLAFRPDDRELDVDFVIHESPGGPASGEHPSSTAPSMSPYGVASEWALGARPGHPVGLLDQGVTWNPPRGTRHVLIASDETGLPAIVGIARELPPDITGTIVIELGSDADRRVLDVPPGVEVRWLSREGTDAVPGTLALAASTPGSSVSRRS